METDVSEGVRRALKAAFQLLSDKDLQRRLRDDAESQAVLEQLQLPAEAKPQLRNILNRVETLIAGREDEDSPPETTSATRASKPSDSLSYTRRMLFESFVHIRWSFYLSLGMSVVFFLAGIALLTFAVREALGQESVSTSTLTIAGLSVADFGLLFYTRPWQHITRSLSNSQQIRIVATSYLVGLDRLAHERLDHIEALEQITTSSVDLLQKYAEEGPTDGTAEEKKGSG